MVKDKIKVKRLMKKEPPTIRSDVSVAQAAKEFNKRHATAMPVVDEEGKLAGIVTPTDLCRLVGSPIVRANEYDSISVDALETDAESTVGNIMTTTVINVSPDDTIRDAVDLMNEHRIHNLPVLDDERRIVGLLSQTEILRYLNELLVPSEQD